MTGRVEAVMTGRVEAGGDGIVIGDGCNESILAAQKTNSLFVNNLLAPSLFVDFSLPICGIFVVLNVVVEVVFISLITMIDFSSSFTGPGPNFSKMDEKFHDSVPLPYASAQEGMLKLISVIQRNGKGTILGTATRPKPVQQFVKHPGMKHSDLNSRIENKFGKQLSTGELSNLLKWKDSLLSEDETAVSLEQEMDLPGRCGIYIQVP